MRGSPSKRAGRSMHQVKHVRLRRGLHADPYEGHAMIVRIPGALVRGKDLHQRNATPTQRTDMD